MTETPSPALDAQGTSPNGCTSPKPNRWLLASLRTLIPRCFLPIRWSQAALGAVGRHPGRSLLAGGLLAVIGLGAYILGINLWAGYHFRSARSCWEKYDNPEAMEHLQACLQVWPQDPETLLLAARTARRLGAFPEAEDLQNRYERSRGEDDDLILEGVLLRAERGDLDAVRLFCRTLVEQDHPDTPLVLEAQARGYLRQFRLQEAMACLKHWQDRQPANPLVFFLRGQVYDQSLNLEEAIASYRRVLQLDPAYDEARRRLASHLLDLANGQEALPHLTYLLRRRPDQPLLRVLLARCHNQLGEQAQAEEILDEVLTSQPRYANALAWRGYLALQRGQVAAAANWLRQAVALDPGNYQVHYKLFQALKRNGKREEARRLQQRMKQMEDDMRRIQVIGTRQMQATPHDPALHYEVGMIAFRAGAVAEGLRWLHSALRENPRYEPAHTALAMYYQQTGSPGRAAQHRKLAQAATRKRPARLQEVLGSR